MLRVRVLVFVVTISLLLGASAALGGRADTVAADLALTGSISVQKATAGSHVTATFTIANHGPSPASKSVVRINSASQVLDGATISVAAAGGTCTVKPQFAVCSYPSPLPAGSSYQVTVDALPTAKGTLKLSGTVKAKEPDPATADNAVSLSVPVVAVDSQPPTMVQMKALPAFEAQSSIPLFWSGQDTGSGIASFTIRYRAASWHGGFGPLTTWKQTTEKHADFTATRGVTYCFSVSATDKSGNVSPWSHETCTAEPLGSASFHRSGSWTAKKGKSTFLGSVLIAKSTGATLSLEHVAARHVFLIARVCSDCGKVDVLWRGRRIKTLSLTASTAKLTQLPVLAVRYLEEGTLAFRAASARVQIQAVTISRV